jgi:hypothetical protein
MAAVTPVWTDNISVFRDLVPRPTAGRATLDLRAKFGAFLHLRVGRTSVTALTAGIRTRVIRRIANGAIVHPVGLFEAQGVATAAALTAVLAPFGTGGWSVTSVTGFAVGDLVALDPDGLTTLEFARISRVDAGNSVLYFESELQFDQSGKNITNKAEVYAPLQVAGGSVVEVIFDYQESTSGNDVVCECLAQRYDRDDVV